MHVHIRARLRALAPKTPVRRGPSAAALTGLLLAVALSGCAAADVSAAPPEADQVTVSDAWVRSTDAADDKTMSAAFMTIDNPTDHDITLSGARSPVAGTVQLHEMGMADGTMTMRELPDGITITAGRGKLLQPGGYHVMLMGLEQPLHVGDEVVVRLQFADSSTLAVTAPVKQFTEEEPHYHPSASPTADMEGMADMSGGESQDDS